MEQTGRKRRVLLLYRAMIPSIRLCGHCQMQALDRQGMLEYRARQELEVQSADLRWADTVILGRFDSWYEVQLARRLRRAGKTLLYILDDDLLSVPPEASSARHYNREETRRHIRNAIEMSDAILSPSRLLLQKYAAGGRKGVLLEEPAIDPIPFRTHEPGRIVKIGFAGSIDRTADVEAILWEALLRIRETYGERVRFEFFGAEPSFAGALGARTIAYQDSYDAYRAALNGLEWDIGLAPMPQTAFHACKHYNKFVEYAASGIVGVYSDNAPYRDIKERLGLTSREEIGVFCENTPDAWYEALCGLIDDAESRERMRLRVSELAHTALSVEVCAKALAAQLPDAVREAESTPPNAVTLAALKAAGIAERGVQAFKTHGWGIFAHALGKCIRRGK